MMALECPCCRWVVLPVDGLVIDKMVRLVEHLDEVHPWLLAYLRVAMRTHDRAVAA